MLALMALVPPLTQSLRLVEVEVEAVQSLDYPVALVVAAVEALVALEQMGRAIVVETSLALAEVTTHSLGEQQVVVALAVKVPMAALTLADVPEVAV
jgi:hypothetical protein